MPGPCAWAWRRRRKHSWPGPGRALAGIDKTVKQGAADAERTSALANANADRDQAHTLGGVRGLDGPRSRCQRPESQGFRDPYSLFLGLLDRADLAEVEFQRLRV